MSLVVLNHGDKRLVKQLKELGPKVAKRVIRRASNLSMLPALQQARRNAPKDTGLLKKSITRKTKALGRSGVITLVGIKYGVINPDRPNALGPHAYGWIQEDVAPFMEPALENNTTRIVATMGRELATGIVNEAKKMAVK